MSTAYSETVDLHSVLLPIQLLTMASLILNSYTEGVMRYANMYSCAGLLLGFGISNALIYHLDEPVLGAKIGGVASAYFLLAPQLRLLYTSKLIRPSLHKAIGWCYCAYFAVQLCLHRFYYNKEFDKYIDDLNEEIE